MCEEWIRIKRADLLSSEDYGGFHLCGIRNVFKDIQSLT